MSKATSRAGTHSWEALEEGEGMRPSEGKGNGDPGRPGADEAVPSETGDRASPNACCDQCGSAQDEAANQPWTAKMPDPSSISGAGNHREEQRP